MTDDGNPKSRPKKVTQVTIDKIISIRVTDERFAQMKSGHHFEFNRVRIPVKKQQQLKIGDTIYANASAGDSKALEFLTMDRQPGYDEDQVDVIVRVL